MILTDRALAFPNVASPVGGDIFHSDHAVDSLLTQKRHVQMRYSNGNLLQDGGTNLSVLTAPPEDLLNKAVSTIIILLHECCDSP